MSEDLNDDHGSAEDTAPVDVIDAANPVPGANTPAADAGAEQDPEAEGEQPKPRRSAQERINDLTRDMRAAERRAEAAERRAAEIEARVPKADPKPAADPDPEPDPADYPFGETDPGYIKALGSHTARQEFARLTREHEQRTQVRTVEQSWEQRQADFAKTKPDFFEVFDRDWVCSRTMADAIKTSEEGAAVAYHLAQNPEEARRIAALNPLAQVRELGKLEARLAPPTAASTTRSVSDAPPPHPQARGHGGRFRPSADTTDFAAFERMVDGASG